MVVYGSGVLRAFKTIWRKTIIGPRIIDMESWEFEEKLWKFWQDNPDKVPYLEPEYRNANPVKTGMLRSKTVRGKALKCRCIGNKICSNCSTRRAEYNKKLRSLGLGHMVGKV